MLDRRQPGYLTSSTNTAIHPGGFVNKLFVAGVLTGGTLLNAQPGFGEDQFRYREYALGSSVAVVAQTIGVAVTEARTLHERPAKIQTLRWRAPYPALDATAVDPVRDILFNFADDGLYQIVVTYESTRVEGLTDGDLIHVLSANYGEPALVSKGVVARSASSDVEVLSGTVVVARWDTAASSVTLIRSMFSTGVQLVLTSKPLATAARAAISEAVRLDTSEAPQRELDTRTRQAAAAAAAEAKARAQNKAAFRP
jgi:hypothetical protein